MDPTTIVLEEAERDADLAELLARQDRHEATAAAARAEELEDLERRARVRGRRSMQIKTHSGTLEVILATLDSIDRQGDIICSGPHLLKNPEGDRIPCSSWNHDFVRDPEAPPAGWAAVFVRDGRLRASVAADPTDLGRAMLEHVAADRSDWSWTLSGIVTRPLTVAERAAGALRAITSVEVVEVSPVSRGASIGSGTLSTCTGAACPLAGVGGKCGDCTGCPLATCPGAGALAADDPRRIALEDEIAELIAKAAERDAREEQERELVLRALEARQRQRDAAEAVRARVAEAEREEHLTGLEAWAARAAGCDVAELHWRDRFVEQLERAFARVAA